MSNARVDLESALKGVRSPTDRSKLFALIALGVVDCLDDGNLSSSQATEFFFNAENSYFVARKMKSKLAFEVMRTGVQLEDIFEMFSVREAKRLFSTRLQEMRVQCRRLLGKRQSAAVK